MKPISFFALSVLLFALSVSCLQTALSGSFRISESERLRIIASAGRYLNERPVTITSFTSPRSAGTPHDYFSEGDYWWPDSANPEGPYIQRDGMTNPDNFVKHRQALMRFSVQVPALAAAYRITRDEKYASHAILHLRSWFIAESTRMNPHLRYAQAIKGRATGRGIGIIDTIHLVEIARAISALESSGSWREGEVQTVKDWFRDYLLWMTTDRYGIDEREAKNNHGTCWTLQVAAFSHLVGDEEKSEFCRKRFKETLLPGQMGEDGSFPLELKRTKPYGYSLFNLEAMAGICQILSKPGDDLWGFTLEDGRGMRKGMEFIYPFILDKSAWKYPKDVMYFDEWPVRQASLLFAGIALDQPDYIALWKRLNPDPEVEEVIRNYPIRQPALWFKELPGEAGLLFIDEMKLDAVKRGYLEGSDEFKKDIKRLINRSEKLLSEKPWSVTDKKDFPPSGDKHDYMSVAPYWWPDPDKPGGLPYIRRDGEKNPDRDNVGDRKRIGDMMEAVQTMALTYHLTGDERFAQKASSFLRVWFLDATTRMKPHLNYAQSVRGVTEGRGAGIIDTYKFTDLTDAIRMISPSGALSTAEMEAIKTWFRQYMAWLLGSENGMKESMAKNNHGTTYAVQVASLAIFTGDDSVAADIVLNVPRARIASQIEPDGSEPFELVRTKSWGYCLLNLEGLIQLAIISERYGVDIWNYRTEDGRSIKKVIDWLIPYALGEKEWKYPQIVPMERERIYPLLRLAHRKYHDESYAEAAAKIFNSNEIKPEIKLLY